MTPISNQILTASPLTPLVPLNTAAKPDTAFKDLLLDSIHEVNRMQHDADRAVEAMSTGAEVNPAEVLTAVQKADLAFRMMMQVRNKLVEAYQEVRDIRV